jgi:hypothetical protein
MSGATVLVANVPGAVPLAAVDARASDLPTAAIGLVTTTVFIAAAPLATEIPLATDVAFAAATIFVPPATAPAAFPVAAPADRALSTLKIVMPIMIAFLEWVAARLRPVPANRHSTGLKTTVEILNGSRFTFVIIASKTCQP